MPSQRNTREIRFGGEELWLDPAAAVYLPDHATLIISDLHLEKGSFLGQTGAPVPLYDTLDTLQQLQTLLSHYQPKQVILLGDTFHDRKALQRLPIKERNLLHGMVSNTEAWWWVAGNHDADLKMDLPGKTCMVLKIGNLVLSHEPIQTISPLVIGHFHPKNESRIGGHKVKGKVFIGDNNLFILPSFGSYTGGLLTTNPVFHELFKNPPVQHVIVRSKVWKI